MSSNFEGCSQDVFNRNVNPNQDEFCTEDNWQEAILCLSQALELHGLPSPCQAKADTANLDVVVLINSSWMLLKKFNKVSETVVDLENQLRRLHGDVGHLRDLVRRQRDGIEAKNRLIHDSLERERKAVNSYKELKVTMKHLKDEQRKMTSLAEHKDIQCLHDLKRKEAEIAKLKERMVRLMNGGTRRLNRGSGEPGIVMECISSDSNAIGASRSKWKTASSEQKTKRNFYEDALGDYETRLELMREENTDIRESYLEFVEKLQQKLDLKISAGDRQRSLLPWKSAKARFQELEKDIIFHITHKSGGEAADCDCFQLRAELEKSKAEIEKSKKQNFMNFSPDEDLAPFTVTGDEGPLWSVLVADLSSDDNSNVEPTKSIGRRNVGRYNPRPRSANVSSSPHKLRTGSMSPVTKTRSNSRPFSRRSLALSPTSITRQYSSDAV